MSFRQLRKLPGLDNIVKDLAEKLQRAQADQGVEDVTLFRQNRVDYDAIAYTDTNTQILNGDKVDTDATALTDTSHHLKFKRDGFHLAGKGDFINYSATGDKGIDFVSGNGAGGGFLFRARAHIGYFEVR